MLKLSSGAVGAAVFGVVSGFSAGLCLGLRAWWPAGIFLAAAFACIMWSGRVALLIDSVLKKHGIPLEGIYYGTEELLKKVERQRRDFSEGKRKKGCVSPEPDRPRPGRPKGQGGGRPN